MLGEKSISIREAETHRPEDEEKSERTGKHRDKRKTWTQGLRDVGKSFAWRKK